MRTLARTSKNDNILRSESRGFQSAPNSRSIGRVGGRMVLRSTGPGPAIRQRSSRARDWASFLRCQFAGLPDPLLDLGVPPLVVQRAAHVFRIRARQLGIRFDSRLAEALLGGPTHTSNGGQVVKGPLSFVRRHLFPPVSIPARPGMAQRSLLLTVWARHRRLARQVAVARPAPPTSCRQIRCRLSTSCIFPSSVCSKGQSMANFGNRAVSETLASAPVSYGRTKIRMSPMTRDELLFSSKGIRF